MKNEKTLNAKQEEDEFLSMLQDLQVAKEKNDASLREVNKTDHVRYSGEINSSIFEMLGEVALIASNKFKKMRLELAKSNIKDSIDVKSVTYKEMLEEVEKVKDETKKSIALEEQSDELNYEIDKMASVAIGLSRLDDIGFNEPEHSDEVQKAKQDLLSDTDAKNSDNEKSDNEEISSLKKSIYSFVNIPYMTSKEERKDIIEAVGVIYGEEEKEGLKVVNNLFNDFTDDVEKAHNEDGDDDSVDKNSVVNKNKFKSVNKQVQRNRA